MDWKLLVIVGTHLCPVEGVAHFIDGNHHYSKNISGAHFMLSALYVAHFHCCFGLILGV